MNAEEQKAWEEWVGSVKRIISHRPDEYSQPSERAILAADAVIQRAGDVEGLRVKIKHDSWPITLHDDPFILYQEGNMSKGKLCEYIATAVSAWVKEG